LSSQIYAGVIRSIQLQSNRRINVILFFLLLPIVVVSRLGVRLHPEGLVVLWLAIIKRLLP
jgi:hypothetical protein